MSAESDESLPVDQPQIFTPELVTMTKRMRFNPIRSLNPVLLAGQMDSFEAGYLRDFAIMADAISRRDDTIRPALEKRIKTVARRKASVLLIENLDKSQLKEAQKHQRALQYFYDHLTATHALEQNLQGGLKLLIRQMMAAIPFRYAVHNLTWQPRRDPITGEDRLTATFTQVPLWFFENITGKLRFINLPFGQIYGADMPCNEWMVTVGSGIMEPLAVAYMFKQLSLKDWVAYNEKFGTPGVLGKTNAAKDSEAWNALVDAVQGFSQDWAAVCNSESSIELIEATGGQSIPFPPLIERMDRAIATICRGGDLSTLSAGSGMGQGASLQGDETEIFEEDDAEIITETLQQVSRIVIDYLFGTDTPLAYLQIVIPKKKSTEDSIKKMTFLRDSGVPVGQEFARQELGVPPPGAEEQTLVQPAAPAAPAAPFRLANSAPPDRATVFRHTALSQLSRSQAAALKPLTDRLAEIVGMDDEDAQDAALVKLQADMPGLLKQIAADPQLVATWENILATALVSGAAESAAEQEDDSTPSP